jgi:hypothetical protein
MDNNEYNFLSDVTKNMVDNCGVKIGGVVNELNNEKVKNILSEDILSS